MKINEIVNGRLANPRIPENTDLSDTRVIGNREGYDIHQMATNDLEYVFAILDHDGTYKGYVGAMSDGHFIEAFVKDKFRRRGIMTTLLLFMLRDLDQPLYIKSDDIVSDDSRNVLLSLFNKNKIKIKDLNSKKVFDTKEIREIFNSIGSNDYELLIEHTHKFTSNNYREIVKEDGTAIYTTTPLGDLIDAYWYD